MKKGNSFYRLLQLQTIRFFISIPFHHHHHHQKCLISSISLQKSILCCHYSSQVKDSQHPRLSDKKENFFISADELLSKISNKNPQLKILDTTWVPGKSPEDCKQLHLSERIPQSKYFSIDEIASLSSPFPHRIPPIEVFEVWMENYGISRTDEVVLYDKSGLFSSARVLWMFHLFGHKKVRILEGGFPEWKASGKPIKAEKNTNKREESSHRNSYDSSSSSNSKPGPSVEYITDMRKDLMANYENILTLVKREREGRPNKEIKLVDARSSDQYKIAGHIPSAVNVPFNQLLDPAYGYRRLLPFQTLKNHLIDSGIIDPNQTLITYCNVGVTSCINWVAFKSMGLDKVSVYEGSWKEYSSHKDAPTESSSETMV